MARNKMPKREIPHIDGGWQGAASLPVYEILRRDRFTMAEIADAFGCSLRTLYNRLEKLNKKANPDRSAISSPPDMENGGSESRQFTVTA